MDKLLEELIHRYEKHFQSGLRNCMEMNFRGENETTEFKIQANINIFWKIVLKDLKDLADKVRHENEKG